MNWKQFIYRYKHIFVALYFPVYMVWFVWLEARVDVPFTYIHCAIDDYIPFCEYFIIPYLLWFVYVFATLALLFFDLKHLENYYQTIATLIIGMTASLLIYTLFPNAQNMRPTQFTHDNIFPCCMQRIPIPMCCQVFMCLTHLPSTPDFAAMRRSISKRSGATALLYYAS